MIEFRNVAIRFGAQDVLEDVNLRVTAGERIGIVGPNGAGKSTLFHLLLGELSPDAGEVVVEGSPRIGYVRQHLRAASEDETLLEYSLRGVSEVRDMEARIHEVEAGIDGADEATRARLLRELGELQTTFEHLGGYQVETKIKIALGGLGFSEEEFARPFKSFSGGWQMRAELARVLASSPDLLMLDEPSNYLDLPAVEWLQRFLRGYDGTLLLISHDRYLLRTLTSITVEVDAGTITRYAGDLDYYLREREQRYAILLAAKRNQDRLREQAERFIERFKAKATKASQAQSRMRAVEKMEEIKLPKRGMNAGSVRIAPAPHAGSQIVRLEDVGFSYDGARMVLDHVNFEIGRGDKVAVVGYNGMGKTTLLRMLAGVRQPTRGRLVLGHQVIPGYMSQEFSETIPPEISVFECAKRAAPDMTERDLRSQLGGFGFDADDISKQTQVLSGGEKIRLAFLRLFLAPPNFLLLDEPTTHLDMEGRATLEKAIHDYDGTVCLVSHDVEFVRSVATSIIEVGPLGVRRFPGGYDYYREKTAADAASASAANAGAGASAGAGAGDATASAADPGAQPASVAASSMNSRDLRRLRAQERAKRQPRIAALKKQVEDAEAKIAKLEAEMHMLELDIAAGANAKDYAGSCRRFNDAQDELDEANAIWESAGSELEALQREQEEAIAALG